MDDALPSYTDATRRDVFEIVIAGYLQVEELCSVAMVCKRWNGVVCRRLWGSPTMERGKSDVFFLDIDE